MAGSGNMGKYLGEKGKYFSPAMGSVQMGKKINVH